MEALSKGKYILVFKNTGFNQKCCAEEKLKIFFYYKSIHLEL